jgi:cell wall-associated NlpC family hydrolase
VGPLRVHRPLGMLLTSALAALMLVVMPGTQAHASPTVAEIEAQISALWAKAEPLIEEYNGVHDKYGRNKAQQADLAKKIEPLQREVELGQARIGAISAQVYKGGRADAFNALIASDSPKVLADQLSFLDQISREQQRQLLGVTTMKEDYDAQKAPIDALVAELARQDADLAEKKRQIEAQLAELQKLRNQAYGAGGSTGSYRPWPCPSAFEPSNGYKAAAFACAQAGKPYVWAAEGLSAYDCSGLTKRAWQQVGVYLPHQAQSQRASTVYVSRANLRIGDLVFYYNPIHHVAIYVGNNKIMHAPTFGDVVRMADMDSTGPIHSFGRPA